MIGTDDKDSSFENADESKIINALHSGEERAFRSVHTLYSAALFHFCKAIVDHDQAAEDIVTESFIRLWENKNNMQSLDDLRGFLYTTARNFCLTQLRDKKRQSRHHSKILQTLETVENSVIALIVKAERRRSLYQAIALLPPQRQYIIKQMVHNGKSVKELAAELDIEESAVYTAKSKAVAFLKQVLENGGMLTLIALWYILLAFIGLIKKLVSF